MKGPANQGESMLLDVSRETSESLDHYCDLLVKWTKAINLIGPDTIPDLRTRHIDDSAQLIAFAPETFRHWADLGSGGGLPGVVIAILAREKNPTARFSLVESDQRKAAFLRTVKREIDLPLEIIAQRIEAIPPLAADVVSARALASVEDLLKMADRHLADDGLAVFPKGQNLQKELAGLDQDEYTITQVPSRTDANATILLLKRKPLA
jgi:16S rRNA (guanine527-N7)-methyltransferase